MILSRIALSNFRGFHDFEINLEENTVLIGENNTGKTSLLDAIRLALSRSPGRRESLFDEYDFHLASATADPTTVALSITLEFAESVANEWPAHIVQSLPDVVVLDPLGLRHVNLRVTAKYDSAAADFAAEWEFLDATGQGMGARSRRSGSFATLQQLRPVFYLTANRDAAREFQPRSAFWGPFLKAPNIADELRTELEAALAELNKKVIDAEPRLKSVADHLSRAGVHVQLGSGDVATIEAIPLKVRDLLSRAQVMVQGATGTRLPLSRHGTGTQSLAVIFLFEAFLANLMSQTYGPGAAPILTIEEPEAHLHPSAIRTLWQVLSQISGQKLIVSHSGDLLSEVPLTAIRRLYRSGTDIKVRQVAPGLLSADEERKLTYHVRRTRGDLFFARCWLLGEGATEFWVFSEAARILGIDLEADGVRIVPGFAQIGPAPLVKLAEALGIDWHCVVDGDQAGQDYRQTIVGSAVAGGRPEGDRITVLAHQNVEHLLCERGYGHVYKANTSPQKEQQKLTAQPGDAGYWPQVIDCLKNGVSKEQMAIDVMTDMQIKGASGVPQELRDILAAAQALAKL